MRSFRPGKYLTDMGVLGSLLGVFGVISQSKRMRNDWRIAVVWVIWLLTLVLSIASVANREHDDKTL